jgi:hypothetical protein
MTSQSSMPSWLHTFASARLSERCCSPGKASCRAYSQQLSGYRIYPEGLLVQTDRSSIPSSNFTAHTQIAQEYQISRTFLYQLSWAARHHLEDLFSALQHLFDPPDLFLAPWILLLRLVGKYTIPSLSSILKRMGYERNSVGYLSEYL